MSQATPDINDGATFPGATKVQAIEDALDALQTCNSGASEPSYKEQGTWWYDTTNDQIKWYDGSSWIVMFRINESGDCGAAIPSAVAISDGDATPSVKGARILKTANTGATTITGFDDGVADQILTLRCTDANTTIDGGLTHTGRTIPLVAGDRLTWIYDGSNWKQESGNVGMGIFVELDDPVQISTGWPAASVTTFQDVTCPSGVRDGASSVFAKWYGYKVGVFHYDLRIRRKGSSGTGYSYAWGIGQEAGFRNFVPFTIKLDDDKKFQACWGGNWASATENYCYAHGYYI